MKIGLRGGHSPNCKGAMGILDEQAEVRKIYSAAAVMLTDMGHTVINCNSDANTEGGELSQGTNTANAHACDIFVSIHMNAAVKEANGCEVWIYDNGDSIEPIANRVQANMVALGYRDRGVKSMVKNQKSYHDLTASSMSAMIVETLFCTSPEDCNRFNTSKMAQAIATGIAGTKIVTPTQPTTIISGGRQLMWRLFKVTDIDVNRVWFFDGIGIRPLDHPDELKELQNIYKENTGKTLTVFEYTTKAPHYQRMLDVINREYHKSVTFIPKKK